MVHFLKMLSKLLKNPISTPILKILSKKQLTIPQILKSLQEIDTDIQTVIAVLGELYHFGLIKRVEVNNLGISSQNQFQQKRKNDFLPKPELSIPLTPLGIPLPNYVSLWEEIIQHPDHLDSSEINSWIFTVPNHIRKNFVESTPDDIRTKILNKSP